MEEPNGFKSSKSGKPREDIDPQKTNHTGFKGVWEIALRKSKTLVYFLTLIPIYFTGALVFGIGLTPAIYFCRVISRLTSDWPEYIQIPTMAFSIGLGFFIFGSTLVLAVPTLNFIFRMSPRPYRGPFYSADIVRWYLHNSLTYLVRFTFLEFITPTPFNLLFFRLMGMKIGNGTQINSSLISDPALITLGDRVVIGGSATLCAHYGQGGYLIVAPLVIHDDVTVGLRATILGGVEIGKGAKILPNSFVLPNTVIPPGEAWGGVPAQKLA